MATTNRPRPEQQRKCHKFPNSINNDGNINTTPNVKEKSNVSERKGSLDYLNEQMNGPQKEEN